MMRDSDIAVDAVRRVAIPPGHPRHDGPRKTSADPADALGAEVRVELVPRVAHGREAVTHVPGPGGPDHRFDAAMARADHQIECVEVELFDGGWKERKILAVEPRREREPLHERGVDVKALDRGGHRPGHV